MKRCFKTIVFVFLLALSLSQVAFAQGLIKPPKPTEGVESSDPNQGSSWDIEGMSINSMGLISGYGCTIDNKGSSLFLTGTTTARYIADRVSLTLYLQKWDGAKWVDIRSFVYNKNNTKSITDGDYVYSYERGKYYRTRAVHYVINGLETDTRASVSSYIYVD